MVQSISSVSDFFLTQDGILTFSQLQVDKPHLLEKMRIDYLFKEGIVHELIKIDLYLSTHIAVRNLYLYKGCYLLVLSPWDIRDRANGDTFWFDITCPVTKKFSFNLNGVIGYVPILDLSGQIDKKYSMWCTQKKVNDMFISSAARWDKLPTDVMLIA